MQPLAEVVQAAVGPLRAFFDNGIDQAAAHALDSVQAKADQFAVRRKAAAGDIDVRLLYLDAKALTFGGIFNDLGGVIQHAGQQGRHKLMGIMAFQVCRLERHIGIAGGVGFVEGVGRKADHIIIDLICHIFRHTVGNAARTLFAGFPAAMHKMLSLGLHDLELFLAHGAAHIISLPEAEAGQLAADLHDLLLIDYNTVGDIDNVSHLGRLIRHLGGVLAVAQIGRDGIHRSRPIQRDQGDDILQIFWPHTGQHLRHAGGFKLEDTLRLAPGKHRIGVRIIVVDACHTEIRVLTAHSRLGIVDDCQGAQPQKVHLQKAQPLDLHHIELGDRQTVIGRKRHIFGGRVTGNDNTGRMGRRMARHTLHLQRGVDQIMDLRVSVIKRLQVRADLKCLFQRHFQIRRDQLCHPIHILIAHAHNTAHIAHCSAGGHRAKGHDLGYMVAAVFLVYIVDDLLTALVAEVNIEVGHRDALRIQEAFKNQVIADGVNVGNANAVGSQAARAGAAPRPHGNVVAFGIVDEVVDDEVIVRVPHRLDDIDLIGQTFLQRIGHLPGVTAFQSLPAELLKVGLILHTVRGLEIRQLCLAEGKRKVALLCDFICVFAGLRHHREQLVHLSGAFQIELISLKLHPIHIVDGLAGLDAEQDALHLGVLLRDIVGIVGCRHRDTGFPREADKLRQNDPVLLQTVILQFNVVVALAEKVPIPQRRLLGTVVIPCQNRSGNLACKAG